MARTKLDDVIGLPDPLMQYNFDLVISNIPGGADTTEFKTKIMTTSIPGMTIEPVSVELHGFTIEYAGRKQYTRTLAFEMLELRDMKSRDALRGWHDLTRDDNSLGAYFDEYTTEVDLQLYDSKDSIVRTIRLHNCWLESFDDAGLDGAGSTQVQVPGTLKYLRHEDVGVSGGGAGLFG